MILSRFGPHRGRCGVREHGRVDGPLHEFDLALVVDGAQAGEDRVFVADGAVQDARLDVAVELELFGDGAVEGGEAAEVDELAGLALEDGSVEQDGEVGGARDAGDAGPEFDGSSEHGADAVPAVGLIAVSVLPD